MKKIVLILLSIALSILSLNAQDNGGERVAVNLSSPGKPVSLSASLLNGSIRVSGYDGKEVIVESLPRGKMLGDMDEGDEEKAKSLELENGVAIGYLKTGDGHLFLPSNDKKKDRSGMKRIGGGLGSGLTVTEKDNEVEVKVQSIWASIDLDIKVPFNTSLKLKTVNGGRILVNGVNGVHEIQHVNGDINLQGISGSVLANTTNGDVTVGFKQVDPKAEMSFSSFNGDVDITFPAGLKADIVYATERGEVYSDFDVSTRQTSERKVQDKRSSGGRFEVRFEKSVHGTINGGGQKIRFKTFNGDILIRRNK